MKKLFLSLFLIATLSCAKAQNTWIQKLSYNDLAAVYPDSVTGVNKVEIGPDGSIFILAHLEAHGGKGLFKFTANSRHFEWDLVLGNDGSQIRNWTDRFRATSDSGIIVCHNTLDKITGSIWGYLEKYSKDSSLQWSRQFGRYLAPFNHTVYDVIEKSTGGFRALVEDSMYTLDAAGVVTDSTAAVGGRKFLEMSNGDLLVLTSSNQLIRTDTAGNISWSHPCSGEFAYDTVSVFISNSNSFVQKVDALTGVQQWNQNYGFTPISEIEATHDGGIIASVGYKPSSVSPWMASQMPGNLFRVDSLGDTLWTRAYQLPHFGLSTVKIIPGGNLCSGGCYFSGYAIGTLPNEYSAFCCMMNADGSYPLQQTDYVGPLDANHDHVSDYVDDALEVMLGLGQTGIPRDTAIHGYTDPCYRNDIAIDWISYTSSGVNRKYSDYDGDGIIDTNDIEFCNFWVPNDSFPSLYRYENPVHFQAYEEFCLVPVNDTIAPGDPVLYYMVMGSNANPVDSIYGFSFTYNIDSIGNDYADSVFSFSSALGTIGNDLFQNHRFRVNMNLGWDSRSRTLLCRTNFQNAYNVNDTIGIVRFIVLPFQNTLTPTIRRFKAIFADGIEIPFNTCVGTVTIDSSLVSIHTNQKKSLSIYPNPASGFLAIQNVTTGQNKITVFNSIGMKVKEFESTEQQIKFPTTDLENGFYTLRIQAANDVFNTPFIVQQ